MQCVDFPFHQDLTDLSLLACAGTLDLSNNTLIEGVPSSFGLMSSLGKSTGNSYLQGLLLH